MMRTTLDIERSVLKELREIQKQEGGTLGALVSRLLAQALGGRRRRPPAPPFRWVAHPMKARLDLEDKEALYAILDEPDRAAEP